MKTILVAEDNDSNYILMTYILRRDYQFKRAKNGQETVDMANEGGMNLPSNLNRSSFCIK